MHARWIEIALGVLLCAPLAHAQKATERYIPIGRSPGLSGVATVAGRIESVDPIGHVVAIRGLAGLRKARIAIETDVWLDRSTLRKSALRAGFADCRVGVTAEVRYVEGSDTAAWIKLEMTETRAEE